MREIQEANKASGGHWFSKDTMRFFKSIVYNPIYFGRYFITSERFDDGSPRLFTVRFANADGSIDTASKFQQFSTKRQALKFITEIGR
jgi:hypothetical protein